MAITFETCDVNMERPSTAGYHVLPVHPPNQTTMSSEHISDDDVIQAVAACDPSCPYRQRTSPSDIGSCVSAFHELQGPQEVCTCLCIGPVELKCSRELTLSLRISLQVCILGPIGPVQKRHAGTAAVAGGCIYKLKIVILIKVPYVTCDFLTGCTGLLHDSSSVFSFDTYVMAF